MAAALIGKVIAWFIIATSVVSVIWFIFSIVRGEFMPYIPFIQAGLLGWAIMDVLVWAIKSGANGSGKL